MVSSDIWSTFPHELDGLQLFHSFFTEHNTSLNWSHPHPYKRFKAKAGYTTLMSLILIFEKQYLSTSFPLSLFVCYRLRPLRTSWLFSQIWAFTAFLHLLKLAIYFHNILKILKIIYYFHIFCQTCLKLAKKNNSASILMSMCTWLHAILYLSLQEHHSHCKAQAWRI